MRHEKHFRLALGSKNGNTSGLPGRETAHFLSIIVIDFFHQKLFFASLKRSLLYTILASGRICDKKFG